MLTLRRTLPRLTTQRSLVTSAQKRALDKSQLEGKAKTTATTKTTTNQSSSASASAAGNDSSSSGYGSRSYMLLGGSAVAVIGGVLYTKPEWRELVLSQFQQKEEKESVVVQVSMNPEGDVAGKKDQEIKVKVDDKSPIGIQIDALVEEDEKVINKGVTVEAMASLGIPANPVRFGVKDPVASFEVMEGSRVSVQSMNTGTCDEGDAANSNEIEKSNIVNVDEIKDVYTVAVAPKTASYKPTVMDAAAELLSSDVEKSTLELAQLRAHTLRLEVSQSEELKGIDSMSPEELRLKIVSLVAALADSARYEAMRLKEYAFIVEKQTVDKYIEILQKQRIEFDGELASQLRDMEDDLKRVFLEKERNMREQYEAAAQAQLDAQNQDYIKKWNTQSGELSKSLNERLEVALADGIAKNKAEMVSKLEAKVSEMNDLMNQLETLRQKASISANFERGSQAAHRLSAAALALANKFETSQSAGGELATLKAVVDENDGQISAALSRIPLEASAGVPTLPELQSMFSKVKSSCRQAAMVPEGSGLAGQLTGYALSALSHEPPVGLIEGESDDHILARAHYFVQNGDLEQAVAQLDQLQGQASFVASSWRNAALSRAIVEQAVRIIKMECALINKNMSGISE